MTRFRTPDSPPVPLRLYFLRRNEGGGPTGKGTVSLVSHLGADFFPKGGMTQKKFYAPPKMALGEGMLFALLGEGKEGGQTKFLQKKTGILVKT